MILVSFFKKIKVHVELGRHVYKCACYLLDETYINSRLDISNPRQSLLTKIKKTKQ